MKDKGYSLITINYHLITIKSFYKYTGKDEFAKYIGVIKSPKKIISIPTKDEVKRLFKCKMPLRDKMVFELLFSTGMRVGELVSVKIKDINFKENKIKIMGKGKKERIVFISDRAMGYLMEYINDDNLGPEAKLINIGTRHLQRIITYRAQSCGIETQFSPHTLRHLFASDLVQSGANLHAVKEMMGHKNITTTERYLHIDEKGLSEEHKKFHRKKIDLES